MPMYIYLNLRYKNYIIIHTEKNNNEHDAIFKIGFKQRLYFEVMNDQNMNYEYHCIYELIRIFNIFPKLFYPIINFMFAICQKERSLLFDEVIFDNEMPPEYSSYNEVYILKINHKKYFNDVKSYNNVNLFYKYFKQIPNISINILNKYCTTILLCLKILRLKYNGICRLTIKMILNYYIDPYIVKLNQKIFAK